MKKTLNIVKNVFVWAMVLIAIVMMLFTVISTRTFDQSDRSIFGYNAFIVRSDSMSKTDFSAGDLILVKYVDPTTLKEGDIISYRSTSYNNFGDTVAHKIRTLTTDDRGEPGFITYGTTNNIDDEDVVLHKQVFGKYQFRIPFIGRFFAFLKTVPGYLICILTPFLLVIASQIIDWVKLFKKYREEKREESDAELEAERAKSREMEEELMKLRAQLNENKSVNTNGVE